MCEPILVTPLKMRPHDSQSSREKATPSSGTTPLASYNEVAPTPKAWDITEATSDQNNIYVVKCEQFMPSSSKNYCLLVASYNNLLSIVSPYLKMIFRVYFKICNFANVSSEFPY